MSLQDRRVSNDNKYDEVDDTYDTISVGKPPSLIPADPEDDAAPPLISVDSKECQPYDDAFPAKLKVKSNKFSHNKQRISWRKYLIIVATVGIVLALTAIICYMLLQNYNSRQMDYSSNVTVENETILAPPPTLNVSTRHTNLGSTTSSDTSSSATSTALTSLYLTSSVVDESVSFLAYYNNAKRLNSSNCNDLRHIQGLYNNLLFL